MERKLDWTMMRKKVEIEDAMAKVPPVRVGILGPPGLGLWKSGIQVARTLRIFLSHTVSGQLWQQGESGDATGPNFDTGQGIPAWQLKIEGRVLEVRLYEVVSVTLD